MHRDPHPRFPAAAFDVVVVAASAGGVESAGRLISELPADLPAPIVLVQHLGRCQTLLVDVLRRRTQLRVEWADEGLPLCARTVHVARPDRHLVIDLSARFAFDLSPRVHSVRPCADATFASAARTFGYRTLGVVLTGYGEDSTAGALAIRAAGGVVLVQDPATCAAAAMPAAVVAAGAQDFVLPPKGLVGAIASLVAVRGTAQLFGLRLRPEEPFPPLPARARRAA